MPEQKFDVLIRCGSLEEAENLIEELDTAAINGVIWPRPPATPSIEERRRARRADREVDGLRDVHGASRGAQLEVKIANALRIPVVPLHVWDLRSTVSEES